MLLLILGILLWSVIHLFPALAPTARQNIVNKLGEGSYKGIYSLLIIGSLVVIVLGWKSTPVELLYIAPAGLRHVTMLLVLIAFILFAAAAIPSNIKRVIRHPQMTGTIIWAAAHLLSNGETRSVVLFGGLGLWAILEIIFINQREGEWVKPAAGSWAMAAIPVVVGVGLYALAAYFHAYLSGIALFG